MASALRAAPGSIGMVTANGGYLTKHAIGIYGTEPPAAGFRWADVQAEVDRVPTTPSLPEWEGVGSVEAWTVMHDRSGTPETAFLAVHTPEGARTLAVNRNADELAEFVERDLAGAAIRVNADGTGHLDDRAGRPPQPRYVPTGRP